MEKFARILKSDLARFCLLHSLVVLLFVSPAIIRNGFYSPVDILKAAEPFADGTKPHNRLISDPILPMQPWTKLSVEALRQGYLPVWNPYSGGGVPLLANPQAGVANPLNALFAVFGFKAALILRAFLIFFLL